MTRQLHSVCLLLLVAAICSPAKLMAWDIELKSDVATQASTVRLGDVGVITGLPEADVQTLQRVVLTPGPSRSYSRCLSASQIRKILAGRGVELDACRFTGAIRSVVVYDDTARGSVSSSLAEPPRDPTAADVRRLVRPTSYRSTGGLAMVRGVEQKLAGMVGDQLKRLSGETVPWRVGVTISSQALRELPADWSNVTVEGLSAASAGSHQLVACFMTDEGDIRVPVEAVAEPMVEMVVPVRALKRGEVIGFDDVELRYVAQEDDSGLAQNVDAVVGRQVQLPLRAGEPVKASALKKPVLVKRREIVDVIARRAGITIKTQVRAIDEGTLDDVIAVEKLDGSKDRFVARVIGVQEVEVCVSGASSHQIGKR